MMRDVDSTRVHIIHDRREGYPVSVDNQDIKEELPLKEFLRRIFKERNVENEVYRVAKAVASHNHREIEMICDKYNDMYLHLLRSGKAVLPQHKISGIGGISGGLFGVDPFDDRQRAMSRQQDYDRERHALMAQASFTPSWQGGILDGGPSQTEMIKQKEKEIEKKRFDDLFFLTTCLL